MEDVELKMGRGNAGRKEGRRYLSMQTAPNLKQARRESYFRGLSPQN